VLTPIQRGETPIDLRDHLALIELFHALRDNLEIDLRETAKKHFTVLPIFHLLAHYPAPFPGAENEYRVPLMKTHGEPDSREMARSRAAALAMVAYDNNAQEMQFLQGWLIQDKFLLRSAYGIPYEFLWANPYQPGLSFHYLPNVFHDPASGRLIIAFDLGRRCHLVLPISRCCPDVPRRPRHQYEAGASAEADRHG
jgi:hypothetical protein